MRVGLARVAALFATPPVAMHEGPPQRVASSMSTTAESAPLRRPDSEVETAIEQLNKELARHRRDQRPLQVQGLQGGARAYFLWRSQQLHPRPGLVVAASQRDAEILAEDLRFFFGESETTAPLARRVHLFPAWDVVPFEDMSPTSDVVAARIEGLFHLHQTKHPIIVTTPDALLQRVPPRDEFAGRLHYFVEAEEIDLERVAGDLDAWGYRRMGLVEDRGEFSVRGGILDVFPPAHAQPLRIELFDTLIESIREFDPVTQRSLEAIPEFLLLPNREFDLTAQTDRKNVRAIEARLLELDVARDERNQLVDALANGISFPGVEFFLPFFHGELATLLDHAPADTVLWVDNAADVETNLAKASSQVERRAAERAAEHRYFPEPETLYLSAAAWRQRSRDLPAVELEPLEMLAAPGDRPGIVVRSFATNDLKIEQASTGHAASFAPVVDKVSRWSKDHHQVVLVASSEAHGQRLQRLFANHDVELPLHTGALPKLLAAGARGPQLFVGHLANGFRVPGDRLVVATEADIFGEARQRRRARRVEVKQLLKNLSQLKPNDFVVHIDHGVGRYRGLTHLNVAGSEGDYLHLEYAGGDKLYLPVDRIGLVQKYSGSDDAAPALDKLGGNAWERVKAKTRESILAMAGELLEIYAAREVESGKAMNRPDEIFAQFEAAFPFEETPDQQRAIDEVVEDLQKAKPMDRLICGDVGYGKTEVAVRAGFLAALSGRQAAVLVPTTVLAQQHYNTFRSRLEGYPVRVAQLSRFLGKQDIKQAIADLQEGKIDIVVGTHRLLQKDVVFRDLGLLVVDEEHRFGVRHKERIKQLRSTVHCLTLTATPIPRTLQMSLLGIRDLSVIETPPIDRLAVRTYVTRRDEGVMREAILRELERDGQAFFVYNRVETIEIMAQRLREIVPEARIAVAHGQMAEGALEKVMSAFFAKETDVLLCSAIIESGIDVPKANTIIIDRADHFGLAQLYQLRGRVGRSHERAYAYLMIPGEQVISKDAQMRLRALQELDDLGGGFKLAAHDLEIRGAGNLLGKQQSGHITAVGYELYQQMMEDAVQELRGRKVGRVIEPEIQLGIPAYLPESYIPDEGLRLAVYRRLADATSGREIDEIGEELRDRFGPIPPLADSFMRVMDLRRYLKAEMVVRAALRNDAVTLQFHEDAPVSVDRLVELVQQGNGRFKLSADFQLAFRLDALDWDGIVAETKNVLLELRQRQEVPA
mgnify:CR=1 FL=1